MPKVSVLMPAHNEDIHLLDEAISSVLNQTFSDFELLLLNDGSKPELAIHLVRVAQSDPRITLHNWEHRGLTKTLNEAITLCKGDFIARMDADDVCLPERFAKQVAFLESHPDHAVVGSWAQFINEQGEGSWIKKYPADHTAIKRKLVAHNQFTHASLMFRASKLRMLGGYNEKLKTAQDYDLLLRSAWHFKVANIPEVLIKYRYRQGSISWMKSGKRQERTGIWIRHNAIKNYGYPFWNLIYLVRPLLTYIIPKKIKFWLWKTLAWKKSRIIDSLKKLKASRLTTAQKIKGIAYIFIKQRGKLPEYRSQYSKEEVVEFVDSLRINQPSFGQWRFAPSHKAASRFASCFAYLLLDHLNALETYTPEQRLQWAQYIADCQNPSDGLWYEMEHNSKSHDSKYIALQLTTFALEILKKEGVEPKYKINWLDKISFPTWLYQRDFSDPWKEGNRILFVGQLLQYAGETEKVSQLMKWLDDTVDSQTGFWGTQEPWNNPNYTAMLGAYHQYILYKALGKTPPYVHSALSNTLDLQYPDGLFRKYGFGGACEDMDAVEILSQGLPHVDSSTKNRVQNVLKTVNEKLKSTQHINGGFCYNPYLSLTYSGIPLLKCNKGEPDIFSTYFRVKTISRSS